MNRRDFTLWAAGAAGTFVLAAGPILRGSFANAQEATADPGGEAPTTRSEVQADPHVGPVTGLPLPRYVSLKGKEGNVRRGPGLSNRIDWVFTRAGMPLRVTAEFEHWRRVEDQDGLGGWIHYTLISGIRTVLFTEQMTDMRDAPEAKARLDAKAQEGVIARLYEARRDWVRVGADGSRGWVPKTAVWGVDPGEVFR
ncbi:SH3 domain-containing protein [Acidimangrovimonas sediminis]|uniref:SH3 domain-containing protein n=1 Tax=Acidimangrovimonas sediminis TaxID=2056283 RepID=UPI000C807417|nr:SH3 domain-containing protein [Acidimangrovimonas sediminis]